MATPEDEVKRGLLSRVGQGIISFAADVPRSEIDIIRSQRDIAAGQAELIQQAVEAEQTATQQQQETQRLVGIVQQGTGPEARQAADRLFQLNPELADTLFKSMGATSAAQREDASRRANEILQTAPQDREAVILEQAEILRTEGRDPRDTLSLIGQSPEEQDRALNIVQSAAQTTQQRAAGVEAAAGRELQERQVQVGERGIELREDELVAARGLAESARVTKQSEQNLKTEEGLRKEFNTLLKDFFLVADANARVKAAGVEPTAAGDLALIFNFMKMLDPGSTVREGEFANAQNSASVPQRVRGLYNSIVNGQRLSEVQRNDFLSRSVQLFDAALTEATKTATAFERIATDAGVNVGNVLATFQERAIVAPAGGDTLRFDAEGNRI